MIKKIPKFMENKSKEIANLQIFVSKNCSKNEMDIINTYWEFKDNEFVNTPTQVKNTFGISQTELNKIIRAQSEVSFFIHCKSCDSFEKQLATSRSKYQDLIRVKKNRYNSFGFRCDYCEVQEREKVNNEKKEAHKKFVQKFEKAIESQNWNNLNHFEREVLSSSLEMNFAQLGKKYGYQLNKGSDSKLITALEKIAQANLIRLFSYNRNNYISDYEHLPRLSEFKNEINPPP